MHLHRYFIVFLCCSKTLLDKNMSTSEKFVDIVLVECVVFRQTVERDGLSYIYGCPLSYN